MVDQLIEFKAKIVGKVLIPFLYPTKVKFECDLGQGKKCQVCSMSHFGGEFIYDTAQNQQEILSLIKCSKTQQQGYIRKKINVADCRAYQYEVMSWGNIEEIHIAPEMRTNTEFEQEYGYRHAYTLSHNIKTNKIYTFTGITCQETTDQHVTQLFNEFKPVISSLESFNLTDEMAEKLKIFQTDDITKKIFSIVEDMTYNVCHIYKREDIILSSLLAYFTCLEFNFMGVKYSGRGDILIAGDTKCGKSDVVKALKKHLGLGEYFLCDANATLAGLVGGVEYINNAPSLHWGIIPASDSYLNIMDEAKPIFVNNIIGSLTGIRSEGIAERIVAGGSRTTQARVRFIWLSNPKTKHMSIKDYSYGIDSVLDLITDLEDISRFDFALIVSQDEVDIIEVNKKHNKKIEHIHSSELFHQLLLWTWSRRANQIVFEKNTSEKILAETIKMCEVYDEYKYPLIQSGSFRIKLAKLAVAVAALTFSTKNNKTILVKPEHVDFAVYFINYIYKKPVCGYYLYSKTKKKEQQLYAIPEIRQCINKFNTQEILINLLLDNATFTTTDLMDFMQVEDKATAVTFRQFLLSRSCIRKKGVSKYVKTPGFTTLLKEMQREIY